MKKTMRMQEVSISWVNLLVYLLAAYMVTGVMLMVLALLLYKFQVSKSIIDIGIIVTYVLACFLAGNLIGRQKKQKRFVWGLLMGILYFLVLMLISAIVNQSVGTMRDSLFTTLILCAGGGMLGGMLS